MKKWFEENKLNLLIASIVLCTVLVTQPILKLFFNRTILPSLSVLANESWYIQFLLLGLICLIYGFSNIRSNHLCDGNKIIPYRIIWIGLLLILYLSFRLTYHSEYVFYGVGRSPLCYTDVCAIWVIMIEFGFGWYRFANKNKSRSKENQQENYQSFMPDVPTCKDYMKRGNHVEGLLNKIILSYNSEVTTYQSFTILLNEKYGAGKTTFMLNLKKLIKCNEAYMIDFKPWLCPNSQQMTTELLNQFVDIRIPIQQRLFTKYAQALANESSWVGVVSRFFLNSTSTSLSKQFDRIAEDMKLLKKPIIVLVDDVDRLSEDELMELLKLIRNTVAFPNVFYIVAADKGYLSTSLANKGIKEPEIFLQKFFNFEMTFPKDDVCFENVIKTELQRIVADENIVTEFVNKKCVKESIQTIRDVYRYCNMLSFEIDLLKQSDTITEINIIDLMLLTLIHYMHDSIYKVLRDHDAYVLKAGAGHLTLHENFKDIIHKRYADVVENMAAQSAGTKPPLRKSCESFPEAINKSIPSLEDKLVLILEELFHDSSLSTKYSISKVANYFKYFAGRIAHDEIMEAEVYEMIELSHDEFDNRLNKICTEGKFNSFQLKIDDYLKNHGLRSLSVLQNLASIWEKLKYTYSNQHGLLKASDMFYYEMRYLVFCIFSQKANIQKNNIEILEEWFNTEINFEFLALTLYTMQDVSISDARMIISQEQMRTYSDVVIKRFIDEQMSKTPFAECIVEQYYNFGLLLWQARLQEFIKSLSQQEREEWIKRVVYKDKNNKWQWNHKLIEGINAHHGVNLESYYSELGIKFDDQLRSALNKVDIHFTVEQQMDNEFVKYILKLHETNSIN